MTPELALALAGLISAIGAGIAATRGTMQLDVRLQVGLNRNGQHSKKGTQEVPKVDP